MNPEIPARRQAGFQIPNSLIEPVAVASDAALNTCDNWGMVRKIGELEAVKMMEVEDALAKVLKIR